MGKKYDFGAAASSAIFRSAKDQIKESVSTEEDRREPAVDAEGKKRINIIVDEALYKQVKAVCAIRGESMKVYLQSLIEDDIKKNQKEYGVSLFD